MISQHAVVQTDRIGKNVSIGEFAVVRRNVVLGDGVVIHPHVVIEEGVSVGDGTEIFPGTYIGKKPKGAGAIARPITYRAQVAVGSGCAIGPNAVLYYDVEIGDQTLIGDGASLREQVRVGSRTLISRYVTISFETTIGDRTRILDMSHFVGKSRIGDDVLVGVMVTTANVKDLGRRTYIEQETKGPTLENRSSVGAGATLLPGVTLGEGSAVAAGSVVTKYDAPYNLVMGVPARVVRDLRIAAKADPAGEPL